MTNEQRTMEQNRQYMQEVLFRILDRIELVLGERRAAQEDAEQPVIEPKPTHAQSVQQVLQSV